ncbi:hypothetical protein EV182_003104 [Spiromyces aspiralis]|uniref:Uncharacterized protein n=1 Tax=Spiromyces aspiralis TaxID=68401 RepID=A0ACC1HYE7_9FUNG|nr:hypothetical protein EV182_003104 [Spiromyces aspiralis]
MRGLKAALEEAKRMMAADCCPGLNARSYMILLQYAKREGDVDAAKRLLGDAIRAGAVPSGWVLAGQTNLTSADVLGVLEKSELMPGVDDYNKFVNLAVRTNDFHTAHRLLDRMKAGSVRPNAVTYSVLIDTYCKGGDVEKALEIYREMLGDRSLTPDQHIYSQLFEGIARSGTPNADEVARMLLGHMDELGIRPNTVVYNTLLMVYAQQSPPNLQECHDIMRRLVSDPNAGPDTRTYNILFSAYASVNRPIAGYAKQLWKWYTEMKTKYMLRRDGFTYSLAVRALHRARDWRYAWAVYEQALTAADSDPRVLRDCFTGPEMMVSLMELCLGQQQPERVMQLWYDGRRLGMRPDSRMVVLMLHACARLGAINAARANIEGLMGIPATARRRPTDDHGDDYGDAQGEEDVMLPLHDPMEKLDLALKTAAPPPPEDYQGMKHVSTSTSPSQSLISPPLLPAAVSTHASPTTRVLSPQLMLVYLVMLVRFGRSQEVMPTICKWLTRVPSAKITEPMASKLLETLRASPADQPLASELLQYLEENFPDAVPI